MKARARKTSARRHGAVAAAETPAVLPLRIVLSGLLVLLAVAAFFPGPGLWGVNHLAYAPLPLRLIWPLLGLLVLWTPLVDHFGRFLVDHLAPALLGRRWVAYGVAPLVGGILFWVLRTRTYFLGDGWLLAEMMANDRPFHGYDFIDYLLHAQLFRLFGLAGEADAFGLFAVTSVVAGMLYLAAVAWCARRLCSTDGARMLLYGLLVCFAPVQIFLGYAECYAYLAVAMLLFLGGLAAYYRSTGRLLLAATAFAAGLFFHLDALFFGPLLLIPLIWPRQKDGGDLSARVSRVAIPVAVGVGLAAVIYLAAGYNRQWYEADFVAGRRFVSILTPLSGSHGLLSWVHWKDILNLLLLLAPVPLALILVGLARLHRSRPWPRELGVLLAGSLWLVLLMSLLFMKLGVVRDWDLYAAQAPVFVFAAYVTWGHLSAGRPAPRLVGMALTSALWLTLPWFWLNAGETRARERFREVIADMTRFQHAYAQETLGKHYRSRMMMDQALAAYRQTSEIFPENARFSALLGSMLYNRGDRQGAFRAYQQALEADSTFAQALAMMARIHAEQGRPAEAIVYARRLAGRPDEDPQAAEMHGRIAEELELLEEALAALERALRLAPQELDWALRAGGLALFSGDPLRAEQLFRQVLEKRPATLPARVGLAYALWQPVEADSAAWGRSDVRARLREAEQILAEVVSAGQGDAQVIRWRAEIRAALAHQR